MLQSIWFLHFNSNQFDSYYFQLATNLVPTINSLTKITYKLTINKKIT